jgi:hypothetical protein
MQGCFPSFSCFISIFCRWGHNGHSYSTTPFPLFCLSVLFCFAFFDLSWREVGKNKYFDIRREARWSLAVAKKDGGFVFSSQISPSL